MGTVYLVGAGPGDPGLITRRGEALLRRAGAVLHDALVDPRLLAWPPPGAEILDVGRRAGGRRALDQASIVAALIERARRHEVVVRLKGGDPFVFGRGGEEALGLASAGVPFEVVPGVTSAVGALAAAGIPLTHRGLASCALLAAPPRGEGDWEELARSTGTVVLFMVGRRIAEACEALVRHGRPPDTPAAAVESATLPEQRVVAGTLADLADRAARPGGGPVLLVVGEVVRLRERLGRG
ncbi:MAG TPA: uroporphyrinogen-III C-methyltransferase [Thermoanaerobaculia bacterium]